MSKSTAHMAGCPHRLAVVPERAPEDRSAENGQPAFCCPEKHVLDGGAPVVRQA